MKRTAPEVSSLTALPNIGREVAALLAKAGIATPADLRRVGAIAAADRIRQMRPHDPPCRSMLAGLEGAIRGVRWHDLPKVEREAVWSDYTAMSVSESGRPVGRKPRVTRKRA